MRLVSLIRGRQRDRDFQDEVAGHLGEAMDDYIRQGYSPADARREALRHFGSVLHAEDAHRDARSWVWLDDLGRDLRYALRTFRRSPGFAATAVVSLAVGIAAATGLFSIVNAALLNPFPFADSNRIVSLGMNNQGKPRGLALTVPELVALQQSDVLDGAFASNNWPMTLTGRGVPESVPTQELSADGLNVLGVSPSWDESSTMRTGRRASSPNGSSCSPIGSGSPISAGGLRPWGRPSI
jgi:hypothetical protein